MFKPSSLSSKAGAIAGALSIGLISILLLVSDDLLAQNAASGNINHGVSANKGVINGAAAKPTPWSALTPVQQHALAPLAKQWDTLEGNRQRKWLALADRYQKSTPEQQARMQERMQAWVTITPEQRQKARENYQAVRKLDPNTRAEKWSSYEQIPAEKRIEMHNQVEAKRLSASPAANAAAAAKKPRVEASPNLVNPNTLLPANKPAAPAAETGKK